MSASANPFVCDPAGYLEPKLGTAGPAAWPPTTVPKVFKATSLAHPNRPALALKRKASTDPAGYPDKLPWKFWTWSEYHRDCVRFAKTLLHLNIGMHHIVNILGFNSPEWLIANNGCQLIGCIAAGIYATNTADASQYITGHSKADVLVLEDNNQLKKFVPGPSGLPPQLAALKSIVIYTEDPNPAYVDALRAIGITVFTWSAFLSVGDGVPEADVDARSNSVLPGHCSTLIYTSGTTGMPKAVMISQDSITWVTKNFSTFYMNVGHEERIVSYLPMSHIAAQIIDCHFPMYCGGCTYFCQPDALKGTLTNCTREVKPTVFFGVPRVWEKMQERMVQLGREVTGVKKLISTWAKGRGKAKNEAAQFGGAGGLPWGFGCANKIVLSKVKEALGLDECKAAFTAAAPLSPEVIWYFSSLDIPVFEIFGQSECTGPHTVSCHDEWKVGTCGRPMWGTVTKIVPENGELCYSGRHIFMGYMYMPEQTAETIDTEGFLHSGDVASFDSDNKVADPSRGLRMEGPSGFMRITGRIKELLITAGGENIPPVLIESEMKTAMLALANCIAIGDKRKYLTMLISLKCKMNLEIGLPTDILDMDALFVGAQIGSDAKTMSAAAKDPKWIEYINAGMKAANMRNASAAQHIQKWAMLPADLSEKEGDLTPTLKLKRSVVVSKYADFISEKLYDGEKLTF